MHSNAEARALLLAIAVVSLISSTEADTATCGAGWEWLYNSKGQNPCQIAGSLQASCVGYAEYVVPPLPPGSHYLQPREDDALGKECGCNTVIYSLYMACTMCQDGGPDPWSYWEKYCDSVHVADYPFDIPSGTAVPHWAYMNYTATGQFDINLVKEAGRDPEAAPKVPPTPSLPSVTASSTTSSPSPGTEYAGYGAKRSFKMRLRVIVGAVVGGAVVLATLGTLAFVLLTRRTRRQVRAEIVDIDQKERGTMVDVREFERQKPYDPSDPSTYPTSLAEDSHVGYYNSTTHWPGKYTGAAEL